jgi:hypothetical protein
MFSKNASTLFLMPTESFEVSNIDQKNNELNRDEAEVTSEEASEKRLTEKLPDTEIWTVYPYMNIGCLQDLVEDYFTKNNHNSDQMQVFDNLLIKMLQEIASKLAQVAENLAG